MEQDLLNLILKYDLTKFTEKFENEGITSYRHVKDIDQTRLRSYYNMLEVDLRNFEKLRNECIKISEQSGTPMITPPRTLDSLYISYPTFGTSGPRTIHTSMPRPSGDASSSIQDGAYLLDFHSEKAVGELKMKGNTPYIETFPNQVIIQDETLLCDFYSQNPVCELKMKNRNPYVIPVANIEQQIISNVSISQENLGSTRPDVPLYDGSLVDGHKGLGIIIAYNHMREDIENRTAIRDAFTMLFQKMNLHIVYVNDKTKANFTLTLIAEIRKALKISMKMFFIGIFSHRQDQEGAKVKLQDGNFIGLNEVFEILKENIPIELPKAIIIQACHSEEDDTLMSSGPYNASIKPYNASIMESNYLVTYSNVGVYKNPEQSSWYIQTLRRAYNEIRDQSDFIHVLFRANELMLSGNKEPSDENRQPAQIESTLTRLLRL